MRTFSPFVVALAAATLWAIAPGGGRADDRTPAQPLIFHVAEDSAPGQILGDVRSRLAFTDALSVSLIEPHPPAIELNAAGALVLAADAPLDHEVCPEFELTLEVMAPRETDALRERFVAAARALGVGTDSIDPFENVRHTVRARVIVEDRPESPHLLATFLHIENTRDIPVGTYVGRVVVIDPDRNETLRFRLQDGNEFFRIDSVTGCLFVREVVRLPRVSRLTLRVDVIDSHGLTESATISIRLNGCPLLIRPPTESNIAHDTELAEADAPTRSGNIAEHSATPPTQTAVTLSTLAPVDSPRPTEPARISARLGQAVGTGDASKQQRESSTVPRLPSADLRTTATSAASGAAAVPLTGPRPWTFLLLAVTSLGGMAAVWIRRKARGGDASDQEVGAGQQLPCPENGPTESCSTQAPDAIEAVLARLDAALSRSGKAGFLGSPPAAEHMTPIDDWMSLAGDPTDELGERDSQPARIGGRRSTDSTAAAHSATGRSATDTASRRQATDRIAGNERRRLEEFRQISRHHSQAEIDRRDRERRKDQWMSVGATAAACLVTGTVCLFTNCFGNVSVPCGTVLLSVATTLFLRGSLYPTVPGRRATDHV